MRMESANPGRRTLTLSPDEHLVISASLRFALWFTAPMEMVNKYGVEPAAMYALLERVEAAESAAAARGVDWDWLRAQKLEPLGVYASGSDAVIEVVDEGSRWDICDNDMFGVVACADQTVKTKHGESLIAQLVPTTRRDSSDVVDDLHTVWGQALSDRPYERQIGS